MSHLRLIWLTAAASALALVGCGSSTTTTVTATNGPSSSGPAFSTSATPHTGGTGATSESKQTAAAQYLAAVNPVNAACNAFGAKANQWNNQTTNTQAETDAQPCIRAMGALRSKLIALESAYPPASTDIKALLAAYSPLQGVLLSLSGLDLSSAATWLQQFARDGTATKTASSQVRADLGLPQTPG